MAEYTANAVQTVAAGGNVAFTSTPIPCSRGYVLHRDNSGIITLRGIGGQCRARYRLSFGANIAVATGGTVGAIALAIAINGEAVQTSTMVVTPAAVGDYFNVSTDMIIDVPKCCCYTITVQNTSTTAIDVANANIIIDRIA